MRMRSDFYEWLKVFHYYGGVEPKIYGQYLAEKNAKKRVSLNYIYQKQGLRAGRTKK